MLDIDNEIATIKEVFRENLNRYFKNKGCTQKELAAFIGVSPATINEWLKGRKSPRMDKVDKLCTFFMCNRSDLMEKFDSASPEPDAPSYYHDPETAEVAERLRTQPGMRMLFDASKDATPKDLEIAANLLKQLKGEE